NPTAALAPAGFYEEVVAFARQHDLVVASDLAYSEIYFDERDRPRSILEVPGAKDVAIEFHSLSKTYNMTGWRVRFAVGNNDVVGALGKVKTNVDSGVFEAVQVAGIAALTGDQGCVAALRATYKDRRDVLVGGLRRLGLDVLEPKASFYTIIGVPRGFTA